MIERIDYMTQYFLQGFILNMLFDLILTLKLIIFGIYQSTICQQRDSLTYPVYSKINLLSLLFLLILKMRNYLLFVIYTIYL